MVYSEKAHVMDPMEIKELLDETSGEPIKTEDGDITPIKSNPTMDRLLFIEAKSAKGNYMVYPCFIAGYSEEEQPAPVADRPPLMFYMFIAQCLGGKFGLLEVAVKEEELGVSKRIWDKPPKKDVREETPWVAVEAGVQ